MLTQSSYFLKIASCKTQNILNCLQYISANIMHITYFLDILNDCQEPEDLDFFLYCSLEVSITAVSEKNSTSWFHKFLTPIPLIQIPSKNHQSILKNSYKSETDPHCMQSLFRCLLFTSCSRILHWYRDITDDREGLQKPIFCTQVLWDLGLFIALH